MLRDFLEMSDGEYFALKLGFLLGASFASAALFLALCAAFTL